MPCAEDILPGPGIAISDCYRIYYEVYGEGEPLILVHGWSLNIESNWKSTGWLDALLPGRQVIAIDVRGHGNSDKPRESSAYSYDAMAQDVLAVMDQLNIEQADLIGYSLGAFSGVYLLGHHQQRFRSMVFMGIGDEDEASIATAPTIADALRAEDISEITDSDALLYRLAAEADPRNDLEALAISALQMWPEGFPLELGGPGLHNIYIPVLILNGENDVPYVYTDQNLSDTIADAQLLEIPGANHLSVLYDARFRNAVLDFLTNIRHEPPL